MLIKQESITSQKLGSLNFWRIVNSILGKDKSAVPPQNCLLNSSDLNGSAIIVPASSSCRTNPKLHDICVHVFFYINSNFISNSRLKLVKIQVKAKQHPRVELSQFENYSLFSSLLSSKNNIRYSKNVQKTSTCVQMCVQRVYKKQVHVFKWGYVINDNKNEAENEK